MVRNPLVPPIHLLATESGSTVQNVIRCGLHNRLSRRLVLGPVGDRPLVGQHAWRSGRLMRTAPRAFVRKYSYVRSSRLNQVGLARAGDAPHTPPDRDFHLTIFGWGPRAKHGNFESTTRIGLRGYFFASDIVAGGAIGRPAGLPQLSH
jgi:hypothetical protein